MNTEIIGYQFICNLQMCLTSWTWELRTHWNRKDNDKDRNAVFQCIKDVLCVERCKQSKPASVHASIFIDLSWFFYYFSLVLYIEKQRTSCCPFSSLQKLKWSKLKLEFLKSTYWFYSVKANLNLKTWWLFDFLQILKSNLNQFSSFKQKHKKAYY